MPTEFWESAPSCLRQQRIPRRRCAPSRLSLDSGKISRGNFWKRSIPSLGPGPFVLALSGPVPSFVFQFWLSLLPYGGFNEAIKKLEIVRERKK